jgi:hypothetical protein
VITIRRIVRDVLLVWLGLAALEIGLVAPETTGDRHG